MTTKERARLRGLANGIDTVLQIGKEGIGDTLIHQADITLDTRELIKCRVLDSCMDYTPRTAAETLARATNSEVVQVIGSKFVLYRRKKAVPKPPERPRDTQKSEKPARKGELFGNRTRKTEKFGKPVRKTEAPGKPFRKAESFGNRARKAESFGNRTRNGNASRTSKPRGGHANPPRNGKPHRLTRK